MSHFSKSQNKSGWNRWFRLLLSLIKLFDVATLYYTQRVQITFEAKYAMHKCATTFFVRVAVAILETHCSQLGHLTQSHSVDETRSPHRNISVGLPRWKMISSSHNASRKYVLNLIGHTIQSAEAYCPDVILSSRFGVFPVHPRTLLFN